MSIQPLGDIHEESPDSFLGDVPSLFATRIGVQVPRPKDWKEFGELFSKASGYFDRPLILFVDEFDKLPASAIDRMVSTFRGIGLEKSNYWLHSLALIGVRSVMGVESRRGSPFNIQRSMHVPNLTRAEVVDMFRQYQEETGQVVHAAVLDALFETTEGQPGLVGWFGELITEQYNPGLDQPIDMAVWDNIYLYALRLEPNSTVLNLVAKARLEHTQWVIEVFARTDVPFSQDADWCNYLYMNGILAPKRAMDSSGKPLLVCRFSCPFIQERLYNALIDTTMSNGLGGLPLDPLDRLTDVFSEKGTDAPRLLERYRLFLKRVQAAGVVPWKGHPRRNTDGQVVEAIGHFHLYAWLVQAVGARCTVSPQFPTGNGTVDLVLLSPTGNAVIEVKSFVDLYRLEKGREQVAEYARKLGMKEATIAAFIPVHEETVLQTLTTVAEVEGITVSTVAIGWG